MWNGVCHLCNIPWLSQGRYVTSPLYTMPFVSQFAMSQWRALYAQGSLCHSEVLFVHHALCVIIRYVTVESSLCTRFSVTVTFSLYTMPFVSQSRYVTAENSLCTDSLSQSRSVHYVLCVTIPYMSQKKTLSAQGSLCRNNVLFVHNAHSVTRSGMSQGPICHMSYGYG